MLEIPSRHKALGANCSKGSSPTKVSSPTIFIPKETPQCECGQTNSQASISRPTDVPSWSHLERTPLPLLRTADIPSGSNTDLPSATASSASTMASARDMKAPKKQPRSSMLLALLPVLASLLSLKYASDLLVGDIGAQRCWANDGAVECLPSANVNYFRWAIPIKPAASAAASLTGTWQPRETEARLDSSARLAAARSLEALRDSPGTQRLRSHSVEFDERIEHVVDNVYVAIGFGLANVMIIDAAEGLILVDCLENPLNMRKLMDEWNRRHEMKPVLAVIYSHFHTDHIFGAAEVFRPNVTQIWAHEFTASEMDKVFTTTAGTTFTRSMRQFGSLLSREDGFINAGIGMRLAYGRSDTTTALAPTHIWRGESHAIEIAGEQLQLLLAPGETKDQTIVWLPRKRLLFGSDNIYKAFPNVYAIRGTESRDPMAWVRSLDLMQKLEAEFLVVGHTGVLRGKDRISATITAYRDAIQFVHDQTVRHMNKGDSIDDIVEKVQLPPHLRDHPYLQQFYGTLPWAIRAVFHHYVGWFDGRAVNLYPLSVRVRAQKLHALLGGRVLQAAIEALERKDYQWSLELASYAEVVESAGPARRVQAASLRSLASFETSAPARNWYITAAKEAEEKAGEPVSVLRHLRVSKMQRDQCILNFKSALDAFSFVPTRMTAEAGLEVEARVLFTFSDTGETACLHFRRGIAYTMAHCEKTPADIHVRTQTSTWKAMLTNQLRPIVAVVTGHFRLVSGNPLLYLKLRKLMNLVEIESD